MEGSRRIRKARKTRQKHGCAGIWKIRDAAEARAYGKERGVVHLAGVALDKPEADNAFETLSNISRQTGVELHGSHTASRRHKAFCQDASARADLENLLAGNRRRGTHQC